MLLGNCVLKRNRRYLLFNRKKLLEFVIFKLAFLSLNKTECPISRTLSNESKLNFCSDTYSTSSNWSPTFCLFSLKTWIKTLPTPFICDCPPMGLRTTSFFCENPQTVFFKKTMWSVLPESITNSFLYTSKFSETAEIHGREWFVPPLKLLLPFSRHAVSRCSFCWQLLHDAPSFFLQSLAMSPNIPQTLEVITLLPSFLLSLLRVTLEKDFEGIATRIADCSNLSSFPID